jgi:hypothetical protein
MTILFCMVTGAERKHKVFAWLLAQNKIQAPDKLLARNWPCNPVCCMCEQAEETTPHLCLHCVYARELWALISVWTNGQIQVPAQDVLLEDRRNQQLQGRPKLGSHHPHLHNLEFMERKA